MRWFPKWATLRFPSSTCCCCCSRSSEQRCDEHHNQPEAKNSTPADRKNFAGADHGRDPLLPHRDDDENPIAEFFPDGSASEAQIITTPHAILQQGSTGIDLLDATTSDKSILDHFTEDKAVSDVTASRSFGVGTGQNKSEDVVCSSISLETNTFGSEPRVNNKATGPGPSFGGPTNGPGESAPTTTTTTTSPGDNSTASRPDEGFTSNEQDGLMQTFSLGRSGAPMAGRRVVNVRPLLRFGHPSFGSSLVVGNDDDSNAVKFPTTFATGMATRSFGGGTTAQNKSEDYASSSNSLQTRIFGSEPRDNNKSMVPRPSFGGPSTKNGPGGSAPTTTTTAPDDSSNASRPEEDSTSLEQDGLGLIGLSEACPDDSLATNGNGGLAVNICITQPASDGSSPPGVAESCDNEHEREDWNEESSTQGDVRLDFGKHQGRTYREVALNHPDYGAWALRQSDPSPRLARFCAWYRSHGRDIADRSTGSNDVGRSHLVENEADMPGTARQLFPAPAIGRGNDRDSLNDNDLVGFGRHSHRTYHEVAVNHADYLSWAVGVANPSPKLARLCRWYHMNNTNDSTMNRRGVGLDKSSATPNAHVTTFDRVATTTMGFGRYKLLSYGQVAEQDPDYCRWALGKDNAGRALREFRDWLIFSNNI
jgi:hypothetical protein